MSRYSIYKNLVLQDERSEKLNFVKDCRKHYVYRVTDYTRSKEENYYGSRSTPKKNPKRDIIEDFWSYRTSSKYNTLLIEHKENYKVKIIKVFNNSGDKILYEAFLHQYFNVKEEGNKFWNKSNQTPYGFDTTGMKISQETKDKISFFNKGKTLTKEHKDKIGRAHKNKIVSKDTINKMLKTRGEYAKGEAHHSFGKTMSKESKDKISKANTGKVRDKEFIENCSKRYKGTGNPNSKIYDIYDNNDVKIYTIEGDILTFLKEKSLPEFAFKMSHSNNGKPIEYKKGLKKSTLPFIGWYCKSYSKYQKDIPYP